MQTPWDSDYRSRPLDYDDIRSERSTSAPPPETSFLFGRNEGLLAPTASYVGGLNSNLDDKWNSPFHDGRDCGQTGIDSLFLDSNASRGRASVPGPYDKPPPGFSTGLKSAERDDLSSSVPRHMDFGGNSRLGSLEGLDRRSIGDNIIRSHSAAPSLDGRLSMGPPPGLANSDTPLVSNRTPGDSYLEPAMDNSRILLLGQRRPASTGVIGGNMNSSAAVLHSLGLGSSNGGAVRPAAKTLMDLIQEDFPPESPLDTNGYGSVFPREEMYLERPRTTSPLSQYTRDDMHDDPRNSGGAGGLTEALDRLRINHPNGYASNDHQRPTPAPQYVAIDRVTRPGNDARGQNPIYAPVAQPTRPQPQRVPQQAQYEQQQQYGGQPVQVQPHLQTHVLPNGQTVYVNAPQPQYGYAVQYHPHAQQHHIIHQVPGGMTRQGDQYISVIPIQSHGAPVPGVGPNGSYAYFQPEGHPGAPQTYAIINPHGPGASPVQIPRGTNGTQDFQRQPQSGGRGKEKCAKGRRGGGGKGKRNGELKHQPNAACSPLLESFKSKKSRDWTILDIKEFCQDQNGSRFIQQRLEFGYDTEKQAVMTEVLPAIRRLRNDVFGNYVVQKLLDFGTPMMKEDLRDTLQGEMLQLSLQMYGCRVVQKSLETLDNSDIPKLLTEFHNNVLSCIHDQNGNHVMQKCIEVMSEKARDAGDDAQADFFNKQIDFIVDDVIGNVQSLSCHPYGCRVLQRILEHCHEPKKTKALDEIRKCHKILLDDQYGNYVIQHVLQFGRNSDRDSLLEIVVANGLLILSRQKFASNVVEKLLKYGNQEQRKALVRQMLKIVNDRSGEEIKEAEEGSSVVLLMVRDAYANYVVQTTLDVIAESEEKNLLIEELNSHYTELKNYAFAKHIVTKLGAS